MNPNDDDGIEWPEVKSPSEAAQALHISTFEFADVLYNLYVKDEKLHAPKYVGQLVKPSLKIAVMRTLMHCWDNNKERLAEHYVNHVLNWKKEIKARDVRFFLENNDIYMGPAGQKPKPEDIAFFKDIWRPESTFALSDQNKESLFIYFDTLIHFAEEWKRMTKYVARWELK